MTMREAPRRRHFPPTRANVVGLQALEKAPQLHEAERPGSGLCQVPGFQAVGEVDLGAFVAKTVRRCT